MYHVSKAVLLLYFTKRSQIFYFLLSDLFFVCLRCCQVLHPKIFGKLIRPQEPHVDLIQSLISESGAVHLRRIAISLLVYVILMSVMVWLPMLQLRLSCYVLGASPFYQLNYWYVLPEIQIPLEIMLGHIVFLSVLDKHKDIIGHAQHVVMVYLAEKVGLTRFLIPLSTLGTRVSSIRFPCLVLLDC